MKNSGKNTTITVVAKEEFAQSYNAQANTFLLIRGDFIARACEHSFHELRRAIAVQG